MATASTRSLRSERSPFLPPAVLETLIVRLIEAAAFGLIAVGVILAAALATYDPNDPSWSVARAVGPGSGVRNLLGKPGAYFSDVFLQTLGLAAYLAPMTIAAWGLRLLAGSIVRHWGLRIVWLMAALIAASMALAYVPAFDTWPLRGELGRHLGGSVGALLLKTAIKASHGATATSIPALIAAVLAMAALIGALGCRWSEWKGGLRAVVIPFRRIGALAGGAARLAGVVGKDADILRRQPAGGREVPDLDDDDDDLAPPPNLRREPARIRTPEPPAPKVKLPVKKVVEQQPALDLVPDQNYALPPLDLLHQPSPPVRPAAVNEQSLQVSAQMLIGVLGDFGVRGDIVGISPGPVVTLYELEPAPGTKSSRVIGLADDIARSMSAVSVRVAVVPGRNVIGIEMPNARRETVYLREMLASEAYERTAAKLALILGKDIGGQPIIADLARMPHLLVAGTTGSGKSVGINAMILSLLYRMPPDRCRFIMIDPKMLELSVYDDIPHLLTPVVTDPKKAVVALKWTVREMEDRYRAMSKLGVRNIEGYNARLREARGNGESLSRKVQTGFEPETGRPIFEDQPIDLTELPYIVVVVDEFADLMLVAGKDIEAAVQRLAQMARAAGIHLLMATQRPSVDVITGTIKANFPTRISFQVTSKIDSRTILGESGAEQLLGQGDMLHMAAGGRITRVHGPFVRDDEVEAVVRFLKEQGEPQYIDEVTEGDGDDGADLALDEDFGGGSGDDLYDRAVALVARERKASTSFVQRHLQIGYNRAARIIERMEKEGVVSQANHVGKREVLARDIDER